MIDSSKAVQKHHRCTKRTYRAFVRRSILTMVITTGALFLGGCIDIYSPASAPGNVAASQDQEDMITLTWSAVRLAGGYTIYRSTQVTGDYTYIGTTASTAYIDVDLEPEISYWYIVGVIPFSGASSGELRSSPVSGTSVHTFSWSRSNRGTAAYFSIEVDRDNPGVLYAAHAGEGESPVSVERFDGTTWSSYGADTGTVDSAADGLLDITMLTDTVYLAYSDRTAGGTIRVAKRNNVDDAAWENVGTAAFGSTPTEAVQITGTSVSDIYVASRLGTEESVFGIQSYRYDGSSWSDISPTLQVGYHPAQVRTARDGTDVYLVFEDATSGSPSDIRVYTYETGTGWTESTSLDRTTGGDLLAGSLTVDVFSGTIVVAFIDTTLGLQIHRMSGGAWQSIAFAEDTDPSSSAVGIALDADTIYLFHRNATTLAGEVWTYGTSWQIVPYNDSEDAITSELNLSRAELATINNRIFTGFIDGGGFGGSSFRTAIYQ